jgi:hypothetical protein
MVSVNAIAEAFGPMVAEQKEGGEEKKDVTRVKVDPSFNSNEICAS